MCAPWVFVALAACSQETPQAPQVSMTPEELDAKAQRAAGEQREIPIPDFARKARFYDLKKDHFRQLNFVFEPAQGSALEFYRNFFTGQGWVACQWSSGGESSFIGAGGQRMLRHTVFYVKAAENRHVMLIEDAPDEVLLDDEHGGWAGNSATVAVYDFPLPEDLGVVCPNRQQK